jgi:hypothetical protein
MRDGDKMTHDDILRFLRMARGSAATWNGPGVWCEFDQLESFWKIVAIAEREECAKLCDEIGEEGYKGHACAYAIRVRGKP